jgi:hypothetical protein
MGFWLFLNVGVFGGRLLLVFLSSKRKALVIAFYPFF